MTVLRRNCFHFRIVNIFTILVAICLTQCARSEQKTTSKSGTTGNKGYKIFDPISCETQFPTLLQEVRSKQSAVSSIVAAALSGEFRGTVYGNVSDFVDAYSNRMSGSDELENSINFLKDRMGVFGFTDVRTEDVPGVPNWQRGLETAQLLSPKQKNLNVVGLGLSAPTPISGITSEAVVFNSYAELLENRAKAKGKIVICNYGGPNGNTLSTIDNGYKEAASSGARAILYRAATTFSLDSNHARRANLYYDGISREIPIAYLTIEDANLLSRHSKRGHTLTMYLNMQNVNKTRTSRNLFGDLKGREIPQEIVISSAHTDAWDISPGVQDNAIGVYLSMQAIPLLKSLNLIPKRTIRAALFCSEEYGFLGSQKYVEDREREIGGFDKLSVAMEADYGCLQARGLIFNGNYELGCILQEVLSFVKGVSDQLLVHSNIFRTDLENFQNVGIPVVSLNGDDGRYFWFHHTKADTMDAADSAVLDKCLATWTATAYILADLPQMITRGFDAIGATPNLVQKVQTLNSTGKSQQRRVSMPRAAAPRQYRQSPVHTTTG